MSGFFNVKSGALTPIYFNSTDFQFADDVEVTRGSHQLAFGFDWVHFNMSDESVIQTNGNFTFSTNVTGYAMADFLLGDLSTFTQRSPNFT